MNTKTKTTKRKGRRPSNFYRGRIPNANVEFIKSLEGNSPREIQKEYHNKYGVWLRESTIASTLNRVNNKNSVVAENNSDKLIITVKYKGKTYTPTQYMDAREEEAKIDLFMALNG